MLKNGQGTCFLSNWQTCNYVITFFYPSPICLYYNCVQLFFIFLQGTDRVSLLCTWIWTLAKKTSNEEFHIIEELSYFLFFHKIKFPSIFAARSKVSLIVPVSATDNRTIVLLSSILATQQSSAVCLHSPCVHVFSNNSRWSG